MQGSYFTAKGGSECLAVLADGTIDHRNGRRCAILAAEALMHGYLRMPQEAEPLAFFDSVARRILQDMRDIIFSGKTPYLSCSFLLIRDGELFYYTVGSNRMFLLQGMDYQLLEGSGRAGFQKGMVAGLISRGVWEALHEKELVSYLGRKGHPYDKAQQIIMGVKEKNRKKAGNATVVLVEGCL